MTSHSARRAGVSRRTRCRAAMLSLAASLWLGSFLSDSALWAQEPQPGVRMVDVTVRLLDAETKAPLLGALIELSGHSRRYVTGMDGQVTLKVPVGDYTLTAHKGGYAMLRGDFRVVRVVRAGELTFLMHALGDVDTSIPERLLVRVAEFGSGRLIEGAAVSLVGGQGGLTDGSGWVEFRDLGGPVAEVTVQMFGYEKRTEPVTLHQGRTTVVEVAMSIDAVVLEPLRVEVRSRYLEAHGVYWRMDHNRTMHVFDSEDLIERGGVPYLTQAFTKLPGLHVTGGSISGLRGCKIAVYWDGMPMEWGGRVVTTVPWGLDEIPPEEIDLVEIYTGIRTPLRFSRWPGDMNNCGAVAFWSRRFADRSR